MGQDDLRMCDSGALYRSVVVVVVQLANRHEGPAVVSCSLCLLCGRPFEKTWCARWIILPRLRSRQKLLIADGPRCVEAEVPRMEKSRQETARPLQSWPRPESLAMTMGKR